MKGHNGHQVCVCYDETFSSPSHFKIPAWHPPRKTPINFYCLAKDVKKCLRMRKKKKLLKFHRRRKVSIEKYYMEIGSLSSCFSNGFKWLYLPFSLLRTNSSKLNILTRTFISSFLSSSTSPCISPINNWIKMLITIHSDPISELRYYDSFNMLFWERQDASLMWMPFNTIFLILAAIFLIPSFLFSFISHRRIERNF